MGCFAIIPKSQASKVDDVRDSILKRGFPEVNKIDSLNQTLLYAPKMGGRNQLYRFSDDLILAVVGTLWYKNKTLELSAKELLKDFKSNNLNPSDLSGTFTLLFIQENLISIYHDEYAVNRFYIDKNTSIVSSSWLVLATQNDTVNWNKEAVYENLLIGFNLETKSWANNIERVKHQYQLPEYVKYTRGQSEFLQQEIKNRKEAIQLSVNKFSNSINSKVSSSEDVILGLSSGYDSRLVTSAIQKSNLNKLNFFTFYKPGDKDPVIAKQIAQTLDKELHIQQTDAKPEEKQLKDIYKRAFLFFDGQCADMMQYSKEDYTQSFRDIVFSNHQLHLSGVGGEMFRNYQNDHQFPVKFRHWINHYFNGGNIPKINSIYHSSIEKTILEVKDIFDIHKNKITYSQRRRFYSEIMLSDWHGLRNSVENQYINYYSAFTDPALIKFSSAITRYLGADGRFEADMICSLSPELAKLNSEYGHSFNQYPLKNRILNTLKIYSKTPLLGNLRTFARKKQNPSKLNSFEEELVQGFLEQIYLPESEVTRYLQTKREQFLAACYIIKTLS